MNTWFVYALIGTFAFAGMLLLFKYLGNIGLKEITILLYVEAMLTISFFGYSIVTHTA